MSKQKVNSNSGRSVQFEIGNQSPYHDWFVGATLIQTRGTSEIQRTTQTYDVPILCNVLEGDVFTIEGEGKCSVKITIADLGGLSGMAVYLHDQSTNNNTIFGEVYLVTQRSADPYVGMEIQENDSNHQCTVNSDASYSIGVNNTGNATLVYTKGIERVQLDVVVTGGSGAHITMNIDTDLGGGGISH